MIEIEVSKCGLLLSDKPMKNFSEAEKLLVSVLNFLTKF